MGVAIATLSDSVCPDYWNGSLNRGSVMNDSSVKASRNDISAARSSEDS